MTWIRQLPNSWSSQFRTWDPLAGYSAVLSDGQSEPSWGVVAVCRSLEELAASHGPDVPIVRVEDVSLLDQKNAPAKHVRLDEDWQTAGRPLFMYVGNLERYQGIDLMLDAFVHLSYYHATAQLAIIGGTADAITHYRDRCRLLKLSDRVHFLGPRPIEQLGSYLRQADVLLSPRIDGKNTPMKIYSYLDSGRPIIATRLPTHTQVLNEEIAYLCEPNPLELARCMIWAADHPARSADLGERGAAAVQEHYSDAVIQAKLALFYEDIKSRLLDSRAKAR